MWNRLFTPVIVLVACISVSTVLAETPAAAAAPCSATTATAAWSTQRAYNYRPGGWCMKTDRSSVVFQSDGNLVWYEIGRYERVFWASGTNGRGAARLSFQVDGNIVIYTASGQVLWAIGASGNRTVNTRFYWQVRYSTPAACGDFWYHELKHYQTNPDLRLHIMVRC